MDQMVVDVSDIREAAPEDEVVLMGTDGEDRITAEDIAAWSGTISYEILLSVGSRVERVFRTSNEIAEDSGK
jgi:alanine racemase